MATERRFRVYIAGPIRKGDLLGNVHQADVAMGELMRAGYAPFNPMLSVYAGGISKPLGYEGPPFAYADPLAKLPGVTSDDWLEMDLAWVEVSDAVLRLPGESAGADGEVAYARKKDVPVFLNIQDLRSWFEGQGRGN